MEFSSSRFSRFSNALVNALKALAISQCSTFTTSFYEIKSWNTNVQLTVPTGILLIPSGRILYRIYLNIFFLYKLNCIFLYNIKENKCIAKEMNIFIVWWTHFQRNVPEKKSDLFNLEYNIRKSYETLSRVHCSEKNVKILYSIYKVMSFHCFNDHKTSLRTK